MSVKEIRDGVVILNDNSMVAIVMTSSLNFALKSSDEQQAILLQFQNFLNSLESAIQIFIQSKRLDIRPYIALMENRRKEQTNELIRIQTKEYIEFVRNFTENTNIMSKNFFMVVTYRPPVVATKGGVSKLFGGSTAKNQGDKKAVLRKIAPNLNKESALWSKGCQEQV